MIRYSVVLAGGEPHHGLERQLAALERTLAPLGEPYEFVITVASPPAREPAQQSRLRLVALPEGTRAGAALAAGIQAAKGEIIVVIEPGGRYPGRGLPQLLARLARADFVQGKRTRGPVARAWHRLARIPRWLLFGLEVRDPGCGLWVARREAVAALLETPRLWRYAATLVALDGFRVDEIRLDDVRAGLRDDLSSPRRLVALWRYVRKQSRATAFDRGRATAHPYVPGRSTASTISRAA